LSKKNSSSNSYQRSAKNFASGANKIYHHADRAASSLGRWATTDHSGFSRSMINMPHMGFIDGCRYILAHLAIALIGSLLYGLMIFMMIAVGIPALLSALFS
jgi:hypothetical protein